MKTLRRLFLLVDVGFIVYWIVTLFNLMPQDYENPILVAWNWSFLPLDLLISFTGFFSIYLYNKRNKNWSSIALISLLFTFCSGLQAITFWIIRMDFDLSLWILNLFLLIYPIFFIPRIISNKISL